MSDEDQGDWTPEQVQQFIDAPGTLCVYLRPHPTSAGESLYAIVCRQGDYTSPRPYWVTFDAMGEMLSWIDYVLPEAESQAMELHQEMLFHDYGLSIQLDPDRADPGDEPDPDQHGGAS